jgi:hypothetical protein
MTTVSVETLVRCTMVVSRKRMYKRMLDILELQLNSL